MNVPHCKICGGGVALFIEQIFDDRHGYPGRFDIYRCTLCGFAQTTPEVPEGQIEELYTTYYPRRQTIDVDAEQRRHVAVPPAWQRWWTGANNTAHYHVRPGTRVLDIGCGDCASIREINAIGADGYGVEPDHNVRALVQALGLKVHVGLLDAMPYPTSFFDFITMSQVLEHINDPVGFLERLRPILKERGRLIVGVPNVDSRLRKKHGARWLNWHVPYHLNHFSRRSLEILAQRSGYAAISIRTITPNLWDDLQKKLAVYPVREGHKTPFLNGQPEAPGETPVVERAQRAGRLRHAATRMHTALNRRSQVCRALSLKLRRRPQLLRVLSRRLNDACGRGESFLVHFERRVPDP